MLNLALDTATPRGRFALAEDDVLLETLPLNVSGSYADAILPMIDRLLQTAGKGLADIDALGVTVGPGSFTGVRIGAATAKSLAWALDRPLVGISTLVVMGAALLAEHPDREVAVPALDARRAEVFAAVCRRRGRWVETLAEPAALAPAEWWKRIAGLLDDPAAAAWGGDGVSLVLGQGRDLRPDLQAVGEPARRAWSSAYPDTAAALALAMGDPDCGLRPVSPFVLAPAYLRVSDAEVKKGLDLTPTGQDPAAAAPDEDAGP